LPGDQLGWFSVGAVIHCIGTLVLGLRPGFDSRGAFRCLLPRFRRGGRFGGFQAQKHQTAQNSDKNAELDRDQMCHFQIHFTTPLLRY
jgi:hypothetical protein